jgi:hypothetical protein
MPRAKETGFMPQVKGERGVRMLVSTKSQAPNYKQGPNRKTANSKRKQQRQTRASQRGL